MYKWLICSVVALFMGSLTGCITNTMRGAGQLIRGAGIKRGFSAQVRSDSVAQHPELIQLWAEAGLESVFLDLEKITDADLASLKKRKA